MKYRVLLVDDDEKSLDANSNHLRENCFVTTALGYKQGLSAVQGQGTYAVVASGLTTSGAQGLALLEKVRTLSPETVCILIVNSNDLSMAVKAVNAGIIFRFLLRPFKQHIFSKTIHAGIEQYNKNRRTAAKTKSQGDNRITKKILVVDDDPIIRSVLSSGLNKHKTLRVITAENGRVATEVLSIIKIDLVITDLDMPQMNGIELLFYMNKQYPEIPVIVLTWFLTEELERKIHRLGSFHYLEKPLDIQALTDLIFKELNGGDGGKIQGISIDNFLQLVEMEEKSCTLTITSNRKVGRLYFQKGGLIDAEVEDARGEEAAYEIIGWGDSAIEIGNSCTRITKNIKKPLMLILMEAKRIKDELGSQGDTEQEKPSERAEVSQSF